MRIVFMGTPAFSVPILSALAAGGHDVVCVLTRAPKPAGRGSRLTPSPVHALAESLGVPVRTPLSLRDPAEADLLRSLRPEVAVVAAYGLLLPQSVLDIPGRGCINLHASLLPRWRGAAPVQRAILAGDAETGVCAMRMEAGLDTGPVLARARLPIGPDDDAGKVLDGLSRLSAGLILDVLADIDRLVPEPQPEDGAVYAAKIDKAETHIDWTRSADEVGRAVRAFSPKPGAWCLLDGERLRVLAARPVFGPAGGRPGEVVEGPSGPAGTTGLRIACGAGALDILRVQKAGGVPMDVSAFLRGKSVPVGAFVG